VAIYDLRSHGGRITRWVVPRDDNALSVEHCKRAMLAACQMCGMEPCALLQQYPTPPSIDTVSAFAKSSVRARAIALAADECAVGNGVSRFR
jgi:hypothetical protein